MNQEITLRGVINSVRDLKNKSKEKEVAPVEDNAMEYNPPQDLKPKPKSLMAINSAYTVTPWLLTSDDPEIQSKMEKFTETEDWNLFEELLEDERNVFVGIGQLRGRDVIEHERLFGISYKSLLAAIQLAETVEIFSEINANVADSNNDDVSEEDRVAAEKMKGKLDNLVWRGEDGKIHTKMFVFHHSKEYYLTQLCAFVASRFGKVVGGNPTDGWVYEGITYEDVLDYGDASLGDLSQGSPWVEVLVMAGVLSKMEEPVEDEEEKPRKNSPRRKKGTSAASKGTPEPEEAP